MESATSLSSKDMQPRYAPVYSKTKPIRAGWQWRSSKVKGEEGKSYVLLAECNTARDNWKAMLILDTMSGASVVARFEQHGSHPGLHAHAHCERGGIEVGASGIDSLARIPRAQSPHRQTNAWTESTFWEAAKKFFRVQEDKGPLFRCVQKS